MELLEKLIAAQLLNKFLSFMGPEGLLSYSQETVTAPYPVSDESNPQPLCASLKIDFNIILPSTRRSLRLSFVMRSTHPHQFHPS
jgi:hypothetical protein